MQLPVASGVPGRKPKVRRSEASTRPFLPTFTAVLRAAWCALVTFSRSFDSTQHPELENVSVVSTQVRRVDVLSYTTVTVRSCVPVMNKGIRYLYFLSGHSLDLTLLLESGVGVNNRGCEAFEQFDAEGSQKGAIGKSSTAMVAFRGGREGGSRFPSDARLAVSSDSKAGIVPTSRRTCPRLS